MYRDQHGKLKHYFRRPGHRLVRLPAPFMSSAFMDAYRAALAGEPVPLAEVGAKRHAPGSVDAVVTAYLASKVFTELAPETRRTRRNILENFAEKHGRKPLYYTSTGGKRVMLLTREHMQKIVNEKAGIPAAQRNLLSALRSMFAWAVGEGSVPDDPTLGVKRKKMTTKGYATWSETDIAAFIAKHGIGTRAYLALMLLLDTGQRRGDVIRMGRQHVRDGVLSITQKKTGMAVDIPVTSALAAAIAACPNQHLTFLVTRHGKPFSADGFTNWFRERCADARLPMGLSAHGLRKARARRLAEKGMSEHQIASVTGHASIAEVQRYTKAANRKKLAAQAMADEVA